MSENKPSQAGDSSDPLASLHRMSTTAGIASQEYVAINLASVAALVLGLASALVLMSNVLLVIPVAAVVFGMVALRHISASNGTQAGRGLAVIGVIAAVAFSAFIGAREYQAHLARQAELVEIDQFVAQFEQKLLAKDYAGCGALFSDTFRDRKQLTPAKFEDILKRVVQNPVYGGLKSVKTNGRVVLSDVPGSTTHTAGTMLVFEFPQVEGRPLRVESLFRKSGGQWRVEDIPQLFPTPPTPPPGGGGPTGAGPQQ